MFVSLYPHAVSERLTAPLVVVIPIYNEEAMIESVISEWRECFEALSVSYQLLLLNDGSKDRTLEVLRGLEKADPDHLAVVEKPNAGHGRTCRLGYDACVASEKVEWILQIDSDGQCDPVYFKEFWKKRGLADCVFGQRTHRDDGFARTFISKICKFLSSLVMGRNLTDPNVPYRLMRREALKEALPKIPASFDIHNVAVLAVLKQNPDLCWAYVPIRFRSRQGGSNSIQLSNTIQMGLSMLFDLRKLKKSLKP